MNMKKVFLTLTLAAFALAANAQIIVGGNLGINGSSNKSVNTNSFGGTTTTTEVTGPKSMDFYIAPKIGYQINEKMSAGIILGFSSESTTRTLTTPWDASLWGATNYDGTMKLSTSYITFKPYFRYNVAEMNNLTFFCEASIPVTIKNADKLVVDESGDVAGSHKTATTTGLDDKYTSFGLDVTPGFNYALNDHLSLDLYLNAINLGFNIMKTKTSTDNFEKDETVVTDINWGLNVHSLPAAAVSFGINYAL